MKQRRRTRGEFRISFDVRTASASGLVYWGVAEINSRLPNGGEGVGDRVGDGRSGRGATSRADSNETGPAFR